MNFSLKGATALAFCLCLVHQQSVEAQLFRRVQASQPDYVPATNYSAVQQAIVAQQQYGRANQPAAKLASYNSFEASGVDGAQFCGGEFREINDFSPAPGSSCLGDCGGGGTGILDRGGRFFLVGEYLYARATLSEALAYIDNTPPQQGQVPVPGPRFVEFDFDYKSSYRFSGGYRLCDCGGEIVFNFARYRGAANFNVQGPAGQSAPVLLGPYEIDAPSNAGFLLGEVDIDIKSYDLGFSKTIPLGSPLGCCDSCDSCCDDTCCDNSCCGDNGCGWCPAWDITWSAGVRFADADWSRGATALESNLNVVDTATTRLNFEGAGLRVGLLGRRYFGCAGWFSVFAKGDLSLLVGDMDIQTVITDVAGINIPTISHINTGRRIIPVTEIEAGLTAHIGNHVNLSSGYFLSAWHDLGFRDEYSFGGNFQLLNYDDANILGFDGYFARVEVTY